MKRREDKQARSKIEFVVLLEMSRSSFIIFRIYSFLARTREAENNTLVVLLF